MIWKPWTPSEIPELFAILLSQGGEINIKKILEITEALLKTGINPVSGGETQDGIEFMPVTKRLLGRPISEVVQAAIARRELMRRLMDEMNVSSEKPVLEKYDGLIDPDPTR